MSAAVGAALLVLIGSALWWFLPAPAPLDVPEDFFNSQAIQAVEPPAEPAAVATTTVFVHVAGEVTEPGLVELPTDSRVAEAIEHAGGATSVADLAAVNLAATVQDGEQIYVPVQGESAPAAAQSGTEAPGGVNINTASESELQSLSGIGPVLAARILAHRDANGPFSAVDDLQAVAGIGPALMNTLRSEITV